MLKRMYFWFLVISRGTDTSIDSSTLKIWYHNQLDRFYFSRFIAEIKRLAQVVISYYGITEKLGYW